MTPNSVTITVKMSDFSRLRDTAFSKEEPKNKEAVTLCEAAKKLPERIILATNPEKLNRQIRFFICPSFAGLPPISHHFFVTSNELPKAPLDLSRFPYYIFGKSLVADYVLEHPSISSIHAAVVYHHERQTFVLQDLNSSNGTLVDGVRMGKGKAVSLKVGSIVQFAVSSRRYELRRGAAPSSKEISVLMEAANSAKRAKIDNSTASPEPTTAGSVEDPTVSEQPAEKEASAPAPPPTFHLYHLVIKHKDVKKPVSLGVNTKGNRITRSKEDAVKLSRWILEEHQKKKSESSLDAVNPSSWTVEEFIEAVMKYSEIRNTNQGDLGQVAQGTLAQALDIAAFRLLRHEVSNPVETELGVHLIYRCD